ncbi:hypothetical protein FisN_23Hh246 [Fistulifera solaris]|uniref:PDZ domain-containing protein n=1 Tax=Fistulifera solaris TaxID=1519565 RepID=A0A1Z5JWX2_FISSO|nr:hypothetical protein FisN_23Hh246 [Fistulifera solaris]|eukprot:GAX18352.1 hypothetical protein FisN_23Hh246 [Fistulifera solaris]
MMQTELITPESGESRGDESLADENSASAEAQLNSLLSCLSVLSELAAMESDEYQSEILKSPKASKSKLGKFPLADALAQLERSHGLHSTPIASLTKSIHRFQSSLAILHDESDSHAAEVDSLHELIKSLQKRNEELEMNVEALTERNKKLAIKLERKSEAKRYLASCMKQYMKKAKASKDQEREFEDLKVAYQLQAHENLLFQANRNRATSADSNFSDGLDFIHLEDGSGDDHSSFSCGGSSLVTDEGIATLRLQTHRSASPRSDASHSSFDSSPSTSPKAQTTTLYFPRGSKVGIKILELHDDTMSTPTAKQPNAELTRALLAPEAEQTKMVGETENQRNVGLPFHINFFHSKGDKEGRHQRRDSGRHSIFVVSGYNDFDDTKNKRPSLGSRIIAINNVEVPDGCTMDQLIESLRASSNEELVDDAGGSHSMYSVTFREESLSTRQYEVLQKAIKQDETDQHNQEATVERDTRQVNEKKSEMRLTNFNFKFKGRGKSNLSNNVDASNVCEGVQEGVVSVSLEPAVSNRRQDNKTLASAANALQFWRPKSQEIETLTTKVGDEDPLI